MTSTNVTPLGDRVLIERIEAQKTTAGGIIIPDSAQSKPTEGVVIAVGKGAVSSSGTIIPMNVSVGDTVLFAKWGGSEINIDGKEYILLKESDILAIRKK